MRQRRQASRQSLPLMAVMSYARQIGQEVHLSTQLNISNVEALRFYAQFADVVVLARELNLEQVAEIYRHIREENICGPSGEQIRIEMFCHGALCMAVSGKCYLSLHEMNHSANRGACMQVCRRSYTVRDKGDECGIGGGQPIHHVPKDLKTIHFMNKMLDAGVRVFKNRRTCPRTRVRAHGSGVLQKKPSVPIWTIHSPMRRLPGGTNV